MSVQLTDDRCVALVDSVTGIAFGPTFRSPEHAGDFCRWLHRGSCATDAGRMGWFRSGDARAYSPADLVEHHGLWLIDRTDQNGELLPENTATCPECGGRGGNISGPDEFGNYDSHNDCARCDGDGIVPAQGQGIA